MLVRLLARQPHGRPMSSQEISERSGLTVHEVELISQSADWNCCTVTQMHSFLVACRCDWENYWDRERMRVYLKKRLVHGHVCLPTWKYLRVSPEWKTYYQPLLQRFLLHLKKGSK